jgi:hypothetical protein
MHAGQSGTVLAHGAEEVGLGAPRPVSRPHASMPPLLLDRTTLD